MGEVNWGIASQPNSFENALAKGFQIGQHIKQQRDEKEYKNALAGYDPANPETLKPVMAADPRLGMQLQQQQAAQQAQAQQQQQAQMATMRKLLQHAAQSPEGWAQAVGAAQSMGLDTSRIPQQYDPEWAKQQLFIADALAKADPEELKGIAYELEQAGYTPGTPEFEQAARSVISNKYATEYVDENGNTRRRSALNLQPAQGGPQPGTVEDGYRFKGGNPADPAAWEPVGQGGQPAQGSSPFGQ